MLRISSPKLKFNASTGQAVLWLVLLLENASCSRTPPHTTTEHHPTTSSTTPTSVSPNLTIPVRKCPPTFEAWYCLNGGVCFAIEILSDLIYSCECAMGFTGERCEYKEIDFSEALFYRATMTAFGVVVVLCLFLLFALVYVCWVPRKISENENGVGYVNRGLDEVDGRDRKRPFGHHHHRIKSLAETFRN